MSGVHKSLEMFLRQPSPKEASRRDVEKALELPGFTLKSHQGSHYRWKHPDGTRIDYALIGGRRVKAAAVKDIASEMRRQGLGE